ARPRHSGKSRFACSACASRSRKALQKNAWSAYERNLPNKRRRKLVARLLADANSVGEVAYLVQLMQANSWADIWKALQLSLVHFEDFGLVPIATDAEIWHFCQAEELILITDNRNRDSDDSLEATIRLYNSLESLPVFTIANRRRFKASRAYAARAV